MLNSRKPEKVFKYLVLAIFCYQSNLMAQKVKIISGLNFSTNVYGAGTNRDDIDFLQYGMSVKPFNAFENKLILGADISYHGTNLKNEDIIISSSELSEILSRSKGFVDVLNFGVCFAYIKEFNSLFSLCSGISSGINFTTRSFLGLVDGSDQYVFYIRRDRLKNNVGWFVSPWSYLCYHTAKSDGGAYVGVSSFYRYTSTTSFYYDRYFDPGFNQIAELKEKLVGMSLGIEIGFYIYFVH